MKEKAEPPAISAYNEYSNMNIHKNSPYAKYHQQLDDFNAKNRPVAERQDQIYKQLKPNPTPPVIAGPRKSNNNSPFEPIVKNEFMKRREEFERNRMRGKGIMQNPLVPRPPPYKRNNENAAMEEQLRKIRLQNFNNRKMLLRELEKKVSNGNGNNNNLDNRSNVSSERRETPDAFDNHAKKIAALRVIIFILIKISSQLFN